MLPSRRCDSQTVSSARVNPPPPGLFLHPPQPGGEGGGVGSDPPVLSRKRMDIEKQTRRHSKDLDETLPNHFQKFKIEVTCQVKGRSMVKIGCFQVAYHSDLKRSIFRPTTFHMYSQGPDEGTDWWNCFIFSPFQGQGQVRKDHQTQNFLMCRLTHVSWSILDEELDSHGYFTIWLNLNKKMWKSIQGQVKKVKKGQIFKIYFLKTKACSWSRISSAIQWYH